MTGVTFVTVVREVIGVTGVSGRIWMTEYEQSDGWTDGQTNQGSAHTQ